MNRALFGPVRPPDRRHRAFSRRLTMSRRRPTRATVPADTAEAPGRLASAAGPHAHRGFKAGDSARAEPQPPRGAAYRVYARYGAGLLGLATGGAGPRTGRQLT